jgi:AAA domain, putative AbiEii toxin, Type IV TA system/ParB-like nuclease domain
MTDTQESQSVNAAWAASMKRVSLRNLYLDPNNFRIIHEQEQQQVPDDAVKEKVVMQRTQRLLTGERNQGIQDLIDSFKANGYLPVDQIQVRELVGGGYLVVEGNRRVAALKFLQQEYESKGIDLWQLNPGTFSQVPVVLYTDADAVHHLTLMALKHISGNKKWGEWNQAKLLEALHQDHGLTEDDICKRIGITKVELRRSLRALSLVAQYSASDYGDQFSESQFPIFRQAIRNAALKAWLGWDEAQSKIQDAANRDLFFSWLSREPVEEEDIDGNVGYGGQYLEPAIIKRDDIDTLAKIVSDPRALEQMKLTRDLNVAYRASDLVFRERQDSAIKAVTEEIQTLAVLAVLPHNLPELESARGKLQTIIDRTRASGLIGVEQKAVFHDRVDRHFSQVRIESYKRLHGLEIGQLSRINLFAGVNNTGKTTVLEAIYLLARQNDFDGLLEVMRRRGKVAADQLDPQWLLEQLGDQTIVVSGVFDDQATDVKIHAHEESDAVLDKSRYLASVEIEANFGVQHQYSLSRTYKGRERETQADSIVLLCAVIFSSPFFLNEPHRYASYYHKSVQSKALPEIFKFLRQVILPTLEDIRLTDERQRFVVTDSCFAQGVDLSAYGEGFQRMFLLSLLFASAQNGVLLIDEFENAMHHQLIGPFARFVHHMSTTFNVQVFLTSHSKECIDAFVEQIDAVADLSCHALVGQGATVQVKDFSGATFKRLLDAGDVDLRGAH